MAPLVRFLPSERSVRIERGATLHDAVLRAGLPIASACGADGICGRCGVEVVEGRPGLPRETRDEASVKERNRVPLAQRLACRVAPEGDVTIRASYW